MDGRTLREEGDVRGFCNGKKNGEDFLRVQEKGLQTSRQESLMVFEYMDLKMQTERCGLGGYSVLVHST